MHFTIWYDIIWYLCTTDCPLNSDDYLTAHLRAPICPRPACSNVVSFPHLRSLSSSVSSHLVGQPCSLLCRVCFPYCSFSISHLFLLSVCFSFFLLYPEFFTNFFIFLAFLSSCFSIYTSLPAPATVFPNHFTPLQHRVTLFPPPSELNFIFWLVVLVFYSFSFGCYFPLFHTLVFLLSPGPALGCVLRSSTKLKLFYCPTVFV